MLTLSQKQQTKVAFIGGGNMAQSMISGLLTNGISTDNILVCAPSLSTRKQVTTAYSVKTHQNNSEAVKFADVIILAAKPHQIEAICNEIGQEYQDTSSSPLFISVAAGISAQQLAGFTQSSRVICAMPNTPTAIGQGVIGLFANERCQEKDKIFADHLMSMLGSTIWLEDEALMPEIVASAGSSPAYFYLFLEAMQSHAINQGLSEQQARESILQTAIGSMNLAMQSGKTFEELRRQVTSPNGATAQGINTFMDGNLKPLVAKAMTNVSNRTIALNRETLPPN